MVLIVAGKGRGPLIDPWGSELPEDYVRIIEHFGLEIFTDELLEALPRPNRLMRRKVVFCHRGLWDIAEAIRERRPFYVLTGIMPSAGKLHIGTKLVIENFKYFQDIGAKEAFLLVADLEAVATRGLTLQEARRRALEFYIPAYIALGVDPDKTKFYFQSENRTVLKLMARFSAKVTMAEMEAIYGQLTPGKIIGALLDAADILYPQVREKMPGVIPVGIDQDPHIRLTRDLVRRTKAEFGFLLPASMYNKFTPSLDGSMKMSKSKPESCIWLPDDPEALEKKVWKALTGGRGSLAEQREKGGQPERCMVFELFKQHLVEDDGELDGIYEECRSGARICGECKTYAVELLRELMDDFTAKMEEARSLVRELEFVQE
ncbi:tryptophan--tRNA ligase [Candidatus Bathyarchaeota archaeon]|nr:MAG: tryptophan--tRNA ligase [Candidatus Bathyarchaeota archaeon]